MDDGFSPLLAGSIALGLSQGKRRIAEEAAPLMAVRKQREGRNGSGTRCSLQRHVPRDLPLTKTHLLTTIQYELI